MTLDHQQCFSEAHTSWATAVVASEKAVVVGCLRFEEAGDPIDCTRMGVGGKAIPPNIDKVICCKVLSVEVYLAQMRDLPSPHLQVRNIESEAVFILLVEKDAAFMRLAEDRFYKKYPCIIITAKGQPDVASR